VTNSCVSALVATQAKVSGAIESKARAKACSPNRWRPRTTTAQGHPMGINDSCAGADDGLGASPSCVQPPAARNLRGRRRGMPHKKIDPSTRGSTNSRQQQRYLLTTPSAPPPPCSSTSWRRCPRSGHRRPPSRYSRQSSSQSAPQPSASAPGDPSSPGT